MPISSPHRLLYTQLKIGFLWIKYLSGARPFGAGDFSPLLLFLVTAAKCKPYSQAQAVPLWGPLCPWCLELCYCPALQHMCPHNHCQHPANREIKDKAVTQQSINKAITAYESKAKSKPQANSKPRQQASEKTTTFLQKDILH